jgi:leucyl aminopeptidase
MPLRLSARRAAVEAHDTPLLVLALAKGSALPKDLKALDERLGGALGRALDARDFRGGRDETLRLSGVEKGGPQRVLLVGLGDSTDQAGAARRAAALAARQARRIGVTSLAWWSDGAGDAALEAAAVGLSLGAWEYADLKTPPPEADRKPPLESADLLVPDEKAGRDAVAHGAAIGEGMDLARRLAMMPGNVCTPEFLAETAGDLAKRFGLGLTVLGRTEMEKEGMGAFLCVAQGTPQDPKLIALEYKGGKGKPFVLVGKGLCFDTGGISIKPAQGMETMKFDMCGAAGVLGAILAIAAMKLPVHVVALVGSTTNMPSGTAVKPGDVVKASNGKSIEIINTDAEGRLVLADVLSYAKRYDPAVVVDAATLTGACVIALGHTATAVLGSDDGVIDEIVAAGKRSGELAWALPLWDDYKDLIKSDVADIKNSGGRAAGTISAAMFLKEFVDFPWAHLDVAGTAYAEADLTYIPKGPTGVPVGLYVEFVRGRAR